MGASFGEVKEATMSSSYIPTATSIEIPLRDTDEVFLVCARDISVTLVSTSLSVACGAILIRC